MVMDRSDFAAPMECVGYQQLTVDDTEGGVGLTIPQGARYAECQLQGAEIRYSRSSDTAPTTAVGTLAEVYDVFYVGPNDLANFKAIRTTGTSGVLNIHYYK